jgi:hypothetical protein
MNQTRLNVWKEIDQHLIRGREVIFPVAEFYRNWDKLTGTDLIFGLGNSPENLSVL